ncbi:hypothetical protein QR680_006378 [Steinernema hermaphroditum]|uniref:Protein kinase domain-containing protein n=1 Tax=Steinernema hermaphroditum TaxID=289476 RepID=A0AA39HWH5_9BILA|nr:hypothetical protein QR680_006378 [Steinernema hermaphroditum]
MSAENKKLDLKGNGHERSNFYEFFLTPTITAIFLHRYTDIRVMSSNSRGIIFSSVDIKTNIPVAIKYLNHTFESAELAKHTYREISLLLKANHKNIVQMVNLLSPQICVGSSQKNFDVYIVLEKVSHTLTHVINLARVGKNILTHKHISFIVYQILCAVKYLHDSNIMHRVSSYRDIAEDLKPDNIGVNDRGCVVKLLDFGLSRAETHHVKHSPYVVTRFYRAPEIVLGINYTKKVDVWSIGCVLAEMLLKKPMFPGEHYFLQWNTIVRTREYALSAGPQSGIRMEELFPEKTCSFPGDQEPLNLQHAIDFMRKILVIDDTDRYDVCQALEHVYVSYWKNDSETNVTPIALEEMLSDEELIKDTEMSVESYRSKIENQLVEYKRDHDVYHG